MWTIPVKQIYSRIKYLMVYHLSVFEAPTDQITPWHVMLIHPGWVWQPSEWPGLIWELCMKCLPSLPVSHILELRNFSGSMVSKSTFDGFLLFSGAILAGHESIKVKVNHHGLVFMASHGQKGQTSLKAPWLKSSVYLFICL